MNRPFQASSMRARIACGVVALLVSLMLAGGIDGLADHYQGPTYAQSGDAALLA